MSTGTGGNRRWRPGSTILALTVFIVISGVLIVDYGWYWLGTVVLAYLMLAVASILLRGRPPDDQDVP